MPDVAPTAARVWYTRVSRPHRLSVRTAPFQGAEAGSIPAGGTIAQRALRLRRAFCCLDIVVGQSVCDGWSSQTRHQPAGTARILASGHGWSSQTRHQPAGTAQKRVSRLSQQSGRGGGTPALACRLALVPLAPLGARGPAGLATSRFSSRRSRLSHMDGRGGGTRTRNPFGRRF